MLHRPTALTCVESFPFDVQYLYQTASYPLSPFRRLRHCFDPCNVVAVAGCGYCWSSNSSLHHAEEAFASHAIACSWSYCAAWTVDAVAAVVVVAVVAAAYGAAAFPRVVDAASATVDETKIDFLRACLRTKLGDSLPVTAVAFHMEAFPFVDFLGDMKGVYSPAAADDVAAFDCVVRGAPAKAAGTTEAVQRQDCRSEVRPDHRKEPSC